MKRRGWRVTLTVATIGLALVAGLVAFNWSTVRDHAEAWWFRMTKEAEAIMPSPVGKLRRNEATFPEDDFDHTWLRAEDLFHTLADSSRQPVFFDHRTRSLLHVAIPIEKEVNEDSSASALLLLRQNGFRILEQRFPRRAYVVVGYPTPTSDMFDSTIRIQASPR